jgi:hypothetical protein
VGGACSTHRRGEKNVQLVGKPEGVGGKMGSERILRRLAGGGVDWIRLVQDRDRWRAVVSAVMNLRVLRHGVS